MSGRIVLFGATGFTGELTARAMVARGARPLLAARSRERLELLAGELGGLDCAVADAGRPETVRALVRSGDVLVSTVGPFTRWGAAAVRAAIDAGAHYLDSTGEPSFVREVFERHGPDAEAAGCGLLTAFGYDYVPGNLAGALALREGGADAVRVDVGYFAAGARGPGAISGGTRASAAAMVAEPGFAHRGGRLVVEQTARHVRSFEVAGHRRSAISIGGSEHLALPRVHPALRDVGVWLGWFGPASRALQVMSVAAGPATRLPGVRETLRAVTGRLVSGSTGGPDAAARARSRATVVAVACATDGQALATVRLEGVNPYDFTGEVLAWGAMRALQGGLRGAGALGPVEAFGRAELEAGVAGAGIARVR